MIGHTQPYITKKINYYSSYIWCLDTWWTWNHNVIHLLKNKKATSAIFETYYRKCDGKEIKIRVGRWCWSISSHHHFTKTHLWFLLWFFFFFFFNCEWAIVGCFGLFPLFEFMNETWTTRLDFVFQLSVTNCGNYRLWGMF